MNTKKLFLVLLATFLSSAVLADEIGSGIIDPPHAGMTSSPTGPALPLDGEDATGSAAATDDTSLWMRLLDWLE